MQQTSGKRDKQLRRHFQRTSMLHEGLLDEQARLNDSLQQLCDTLSRLKDELGKYKKDKAQFGGIRADLDLVYRDRKRIYLSEVELERIRRLEDGLDKENQALVDEINEQRTKHYSTRSLFLQTRADLQAAQAELQRELTKSENATAATLRLEDYRDVFEASELKAMMEDEATLMKLEARLKRARRLQRLARVGTKQQREKAGKTMQAEHAEQAKEYKEQLQRIHQLQDDIKNLEGEKNTCAETSESLRQQREQLSDILDRMAVRANVRSHDELIRMFQASEDDRLEQARCIQRCGDEQKNVEYEIREALQLYDATVQEKRRRTRAAQQAAAAGQTELMHNDVMCRLAHKEIRNSKLQLGQATEMLHRLLLRTRPDSYQMAVFKHVSKALAPPRKDKTGYSSKQRLRGSSHAVGHRPFLSGERQSYLHDSRLDKDRSNSMDHDEAASHLSDAPRAMSPVSVADAGLDGDLGEDQPAEDENSEPSEGRARGSDSVSASYAQQLVGMAETSASRAIERAAVLLLQPHVRSKTVSVLRYALPEGPPDSSVDETIISSALQMYRRGPAAGLEQADVGRDSRKSARANLEERYLGQGSLTSAVGGEEGHEWMDESELPVDQSTSLQESMASVMSGSLPNLPSLPDLSENPAALAYTLSMVQQLESTGQLPPPDTQPLATSGLGGSESSSRVGSQSSLQGVSGLLASRKQVGPVSRDALDRWMEQASVALRQPPVPAIEERGGTLHGLGAPGTPMGRAGRRVMHGDGGFRSTVLSGGGGLGRADGEVNSSLQRHPADKISGTSHVPMNDRNRTVLPEQAEATMAQLTPMRA